VSLAEAGLVLGHVSEARQHLGEAEAAAGQTDDVRNRIRIALLRAKMHQVIDGATDDAERDLREAAELADESGVPEYQVLAQMRMGLFAYRAGRLAHAEDAFRRAATLARERGSLQSEATATCFLANVLYHFGPRDEAERLAHQAAQWLERLNDRYLQGQALQLVAQLRLDGDDPSEAQRVTTEAIAIMPPQPVMVAALQRHLAEARARQGRAIGARAAAAAADEAAPKQDPYARAFAEVAQGWAGGAEGSLDLVRRAFDTAVSLLEDLDMTTDVAETRIAYARALSHLGDVAAATVQLELARKVFEEMGAHASVAFVDELFEKMSGGADLFGPSA
jgi:tetratricopeptide (TPR) repeat protein